MLCNSDAANRAFSTFLRAVAAEKQNNMSEREAHNCGINVAVTLEEGNTCKEYDAYKGGEPRLSPLRSKPYTELFPDNTDSSISVTSSTSLSSKQIHQHNKIYKYFTT